MNEVIVIGAGITGLVCARALSAPVIEKSRGVGGRLATRRIDDEKFDHGLPHWPLSPESSALFAKTSHPEGLTAIAKELARGLELHKETRVEKLVRLPAGWLLECSDQREFQARKVILTAPVPQALELLEKSGLAVAPHWQVPYHKALVGLFRLPLVPSDKSLEWSGHRLVLQREKALCADGAVLIASPAFSEEHFERDEKIVLEGLTQLLREALPNAGVSFAELKKWRYSTPARSHECAYLEAAEGLYLAGDGFLTPDLNGALGSAKTLLREQFKVL